MMIDSIGQVVITGKALHPHTALIETNATKHDW